MTDEHDAPPTDPTTYATGGVVHPPVAIQAAAARIRRFLEHWGTDGLIVGYAEDFQLNADDLVVVLDALDACTIPTGVITIPKALTEQEYEEAKARFLAAQRESHIEIHWNVPLAGGSDGVLEAVRRYVRALPGGGRTTGA